MADVKESAMAQKNDCKWVRALDSNGNSILISKEDLASVVGGLLPAANVESNGLFSKLDYIRNCQMVEGATLQLIKLGDKERICVIDVVFWINQFGTARFILRRDNSDNMMCKKVYNTISDTYLKFFYDSNKNFYIQPANAVGIRIVSVYSTSIFTNTNKTDTYGLTELTITE